MTQANIAESENESGLDMGTHKDYNGLWKIGKEDKEY